MKNNFELDTNICIREIFAKDKYVINPQMNIIYELQNNIDGCVVLPQKQNNQYFDIKKNFVNNIINPLSYFELPINSNNFLEIIFNINNINNLYDWFINYKISKDIESDEILNLVLNLFWYKKFNIIKNNIEDFIQFNKILIKLIYNKVLELNILSRIIIKLVKKYHNKKILYLVKLKKYLMKYYNK